MAYFESMWNRSNTEQALGVTGQDMTRPAPLQYLLVQLVKPLRAQSQILNTLSQAVQTLSVPRPTHLATWHRHTRAEKCYTFFIIQGMAKIQRATVSNYSYLIQVNANARKQRPFKHQNMIEQGLIFHAIVFWNYKLLHHSFITFDMRVCVCVPGWLRTYTAGPTWKW